MSRHFYHILRHAFFAPTYRPLAPHEFDWELLLVLLVPGTFFMAWAWMALQLPVPQCLLREFVGVPCFGCGSTTSLQLLLKGQFRAAFLSNPLFFCSVMGLIGVWTGSVMLVVRGRRRLRWNCLSCGEKWVLRCVVATLLLGNWIYQIWK